MAEERSADKDDDIEERDEERSLGDVASEGAAGDADEETSGEGGEPEANSLGHLRFVYAAFFGFAILSAFLYAKLGQAGWHKLATFKPEVGEPHDEWLYPGALLLGALSAFGFWRRESTRTYIEEVAAELAKVTWPTRKEVTNATTVVVVTTLVATIFFFVMDGVWKVVTDKVYGI